MSKKGRSTPTDSDVNAFCAFHPPTFPPELDEANDEATLPAIVDQSLISKSGFRRSGFGGSMTSPADDDDDSDGDDDDDDAEGAGSIAGGGGSEESAVEESGNQPIPPSNSKKQQRSKSSSH